MARNGKGFSRFLDFIGLVDADQDEDQDLGGVSLTEFPVYVSYPAFFAGDDAIDGANQAIFGLNGTTTRVLTRGASRSGSCRG